MSTIQARQAAERAIIQARLDRAKEEARQGAVQARLDRAAQLSARMAELLGPAATEESLRDYLDQCSSLEEAALQIVADVERMYREPLEDHDVVEIVSALQRLAEA